MIAPQVVKYVSLPFPPAAALRTSTDNDQRFSEEFPGAHFVKVDVDEVPDVAQELGVRAMPTFIVFKGGEKVGEVVGANPKALLAAIQKHTSEESKHE